MSCSSQRRLTVSMLTKSFCFVFQSLHCFSYPEVSSSLSRSANIDGAGVLGCCQLCVCASPVVSFLWVSVGSGQQQRAGRGAGGQEHHASGRFDSCSGLPQPPDGVDPRQTQGPAESGALGPGPQQSGVLHGANPGHVSRRSSEGLQQLQQGADLNS